MRPTTDSLLIGNPPLKKWGTDAVVQPSKKQAAYPDRLLFYFYQNLSRHKVIKHLRQIRDKLLGGIGILNTKDCGDFKKKDYLIMDCISRHISFHLSNHINLSKLEHEKQICQDSIKNPPVGVIMLDGKFNTISCNETAMEYCADITCGHLNKVPVRNIVEAILANVINNFQNDHQIS